MFVICEDCGYVHEKKLYKKNQSICSVCNHYGRLGAMERIELVVDKNSFREVNDDFGFYDPVCFPGYQEKYNVAKENAQINEAIITGIGHILDIRVMLGVMESQFMMGSMGAVVGEKVSRAFEKAQHEQIPVIMFCASGGARMQEGIISLMQMAKTSSAIAKYSEMGGFYISVLTHPTTGGVSASFAFLGDIILAEPRALIGFAGKRVIESTINEEIPENFQTSEYLLEHGFIDSIIDRQGLRMALYQLLKLHKR